MTADSHHGSGSLLLRALPTSLPKVEVFRVRPQHPDPSSLGDGRDSERFGYNDDAEWKQDVYYTRWVPPLESELAKQVEYDMDENDREWMDMYNAERHADGLERISYEFFEILVDKLEKEWFDLQKHIPKPASNLPAEDSKCAICDDGECEASNAIVFCDGCNLAVHQDCYGVPYIPEGQWLCRKCTVSPDRPVSCALCPADFGAFKQTTNGKWAHLLCAIWINETGVSNTVYMEPVDGLESIPKGRWKLVCYLCKQKVGACIQCSKGNCYTAYHVTCARDYGLHLRLGTSSGMVTSDGSPGENVSYCGKHSTNRSLHDDEREESEELPIPGYASRPSTPGMRKQPTKKLQSYAQRHPSETPDTAKDEHFPLRPLQSTKQKMAYKKSFASAGPPVIPHFIFEKIWDYIKPLRCKQKNTFVKLVCRYWSLKRESRRGAPLLKRLHLEPWTASGGSRQATDLEKSKKLELILLLRKDLEEVRTLTELVRKREREKLRRSHLLKTIIEQIIFPQTATFKTVLKQIVQLDVKGLFLEEVNRQEVPDYYDVISHPMWWNKISANLEENAYLTAAEFQADVRLVLANALRYNKPEDRHGKAALRIRELSHPILEGLNSLDERGSLTHRLHEEMLGLLDEGTVHRMMQLWYPKPPPEVQPAALEPAPQPIPEYQRASGSAAAMHPQGPAVDQPITVVEPVQAPAMPESMPQITGLVAPHEQEPLVTSRKRKISQLEDTQAPDQSMQAPTRTLRGAPAEQSSTLRDTTLHQITRTTEQELAHQAVGTSRSTRSKSPVKVTEESQIERRKRSRSEELELKRVAERARKAKMRAKRARDPESAGPPIIPIPQRGEPPQANNDGSMEVDGPDVTNHDSFLLFNTGWVLPEGSTRRRARSALDTGPTSANNQKQNAQPATSILPQGARTAPMLSVPLPKQSPQRIAAPLPPTVEAVAEEPEMLDSDLSDVEDGSQPLYKTEEAGVESAIAQDPSVKIEQQNTLSSAISELSELSDVEDVPEDLPKAPTPPKRHSGSHRSPPSATLGPAKTRRMLAAEAALFHSSSETSANAVENAAPAQASPPLANVTNLTRSAAAKAKAPASAAQQKQRSETPSKPPTRSTRQSATPDTTLPSKETTKGLLTGPAALARVAELAQLVCYSSIDKINDYDLVWARAKASDPYWPAEVCTDYEDKKRGIPKAVRATMPDGVVGSKLPTDYQPPSDGEREVLVEYFGKTRLWGYVKLKNICELGENQELDALLQTRGAQPKNAKSKANPAVLAKAYQDAIAVAEIPADLEDNDDEDKAAQASA